MKTSNKLILFFFLSAIAILGAIHLALFSKYRRGLIETEKELNEEQFNSFRMQAPKWLSLNGHLHVNIIPSDSFHISLDKNARGLGYRLQGDTLIITGNTEGDKNPHGSWNEYWNLPRVNIFCTGLSGIRVVNSYVAITNEKGKAGVAAFFTLKDAQLWIGAFDPVKDSVFNTEPFDSIVVGETNSTVVINRQSLVHKLSVQLDNVSEITDRFSRIDTGRIVAGRYSKIYMTAANFNKIGLSLSNDSDSGKTSGPWHPRSLPADPSTILHIKKYVKKKQ
jgi:hypothetical protein